MPPRHAKTETITVRYAPYCLERDPTENVLITGYNERFARRLSRKARAVASARLQLSTDKKAEDEWQMPQGGVLMARGVGSPPTGVGFKRIIIDDPIRRREDAESENFREKVWDWYTDDLYTRLEPDGAIVLVMTLWHEDDIGARAIASEPGRWTILKLPALAEPGDAIGRALNEPLWPERYDRAALDRIRQVLIQNEGERSWLALFQQRPTAREGTLFKRHWFENRYRRLPELTEVWTTWDTAIKAREENDETACVTAGAGEDGNCYILRVAHGRWETPDVAKFLIAQADWYRKAYGDRYRGDYIEDKVSGTTLMQYVRRERRELNVIPVPVEADKVSRANGVTPMCQGGRVILPDPYIYPATAADIGYLLHQLTSFPNAPHDDLTDAFVYSLKRFLGTLGNRKSRRSKRGGVV